ncbi:hypothetical protein F5Y15DRAFT_273147 [Xylariaceae sp. FL0016]|nr:hypothetical protein F5Y15DRAFT_273147 [Xylariaceae sp. FL0016]
MCRGVFTRFRSANGSAHGCILRRLLRQHRNKTGHNNAVAPRQASCNIDRTTVSHHHGKSIFDLTSDVLTLRILGLILTYVHTYIHTYILMVHQWLALFLCALNPVRHLITPAVIALKWTSRYVTVGPQLYDIYSGVAERPMGPIRSNVTC